MSDVDLYSPPASDAVRDAVHVAIVPLICGDNYLYAGMSVKLAYGTTDTAIKCDDVYNDGKIESIGVVSPFLKDREIIRKGDRFWCMLNPGTVTGMKHHWEHPLFDSPTNLVSDSELWLRRFAETWNFDFDDMISAAKEGDYILARGTDLHGKSELGEDYTLFWHNLELYLGRKFSDDHREQVNWTCTC